MQESEESSAAFTIKAHPSAEMSQGAPDQLPDRRPAKLKNVHVKAPGQPDNLLELLDSVPFTPSQGVRSPTPRSNGMVQNMPRNAPNLMRPRGMFDRGPPSPMMRGEPSGEWRPMFVGVPVHPPSYPTSPHTPAPASPVQGQAWSGGPFAPVPPHIAYIAHGGMNMMPHMMHDMNYSGGMMMPHDMGMMTMAGMPGLDSAAMHNPMMGPQSLPLRMPDRPPPMPPIPPQSSRPRSIPPQARGAPAKSLDIVSVQERLQHAHINSSPPYGHAGARAHPGPRNDSSTSPGPGDRRRPLGGRGGGPPGMPRIPPRGAGPPAGTSHAEADDIISSEGSPGKDSPDAAAKTKVEPRVGPDGELIFNARQRRTLRRALQRQRKLVIDDGRDFDITQPFSEQEKAIILEVIEQHISWNIPRGTDIEKLARTLLCLGPNEADTTSPRAGPQLGPPTPR